LRSNDPSCVKALVNALGTYPNHPWIHKPPKCLGACIEERLKAMGPTAFEGIVWSLSNPKTRRVAARLCGELRITCSVEPLLDALLQGERDGDVIAEALGKIGDLRACASLVKCAAEGTQRARCSAIKALGKIKCPGAVSPLLGILSEALNDRRPASQRPDQATRELVTTLGEIGDSSAVPTLIAALSRVSVKGLAVVVLGKIGDGRAVQPLLKLVKPGFPAQSAIDAILNILRMSAGSLQTGDLQDISRLEDFSDVVSEQNYDGYQALERRVNISCGLIRSLAKDELNRRNI